MLESVKIARRQSEIRQKLAEIVGKAQPSEDETRAMETLDAEYRTNETRYRAALIAEDGERRQAGQELETRGASEWRGLVSRFELRQAALFLDEGRSLDGATAEVVAELRTRGGYRGIPVPLEALETRAGETVATGTPEAIQTRPIIDRLFPTSAAARMGAQLIAIDSGSVEWPVATAGATVAWQTSETGAVGGPSAYATTDRPLKPENTLGVQMKITRKALKQSGAALEEAVRRDMNGAMGAEMDRVVFLGSGAAGEPLGVIAGAATYGITETAVDAAPTWGAFRDAAIRFMTANAITAPSQIRALIRPEVWGDLDAQAAGDASPIWMFDRLTAAFGAQNVTQTAHALAAPSGSPVASKALLTTASGGVPAMFVGMWGAVDMIRDPFSDAQSGGLRITALATMDVSVARAVQLQVLTGLQRYVAP